MLKDKNVIVDTMPILYFGNLDAYKKSKLKIVTVSLKVMDIVTANKAFQFKKDGVGYCKFAKTLEDWNDGDYSVKPL